MRRRTVVILLVLAVIVANAIAVAPFRPFTLERDEERYVEISGVLEGCDKPSPGTGDLIATQDVRFDVLGQSLDASVPVRPEIQIERGPGCRGP